MNNKIYKIGKKQYNKIFFSSPTNKVSGALFGQMKDTRIHEAVLIPKKVWNIKSHPGNLVHYYQSKIGRGNWRFKTSALPHKTGWAVLRVK